jgi:hypothetical protein
MSTVKATNFQNASSATANMVTDASGNVSFGGTAVMSSSFLRNRIINGNIAVDQRNAGATQTFTAAAALAYSVDRWYGYCTGANVTGARVTGATANQYRYQFTGAASVTAIGFGHRIEALNSADLAGTTATLSVVLANTLLTTVTWTAYYANTADTFGSLASPTVTSIATGTFTVTSTATQYSVNITVPAAATTGIQILFTVGAQISGTWTIGNVQLEPGTVATPFERQIYSNQLEQCQRYFYKSSAAQNSLSYFGNCMAYSTTQSFGVIQYPVQMRTTPTLSTTATASNYRVIMGNTSYASTSVPSLDQANETTAVVLYTSAGTQTVGYGGMMGANTSTAAFLGFSAEL